MSILSTQGNASIEFGAAGIDFRSDHIDAQSIQGSQVQYSGAGSVNGNGGYHFTLSATAGTGKDRVRMRIWHDGTGSPAGMVDYDNQSPSPLQEGAITVQPD